MKTYVGYHGTTTRCQHDIEKYGFDPDRTHHRDDHWLGNGVYFFLKISTKRFGVLHMFSQNIRQNRKLKVV